MYIYTPTTCRRSRDGLSSLAFSRVYVNALILTLILPNLELATGHKEIRNHLNVGVILLKNEGRVQAFPMLFQNRKAHRRFISPIRFFFIR